MGASSDSGILDALRSKGYVVLRNLVNSEVIDQVNSELEPWFKKTPKCQGDFYGWQTTRFGSLLTKAPSSQELASHKRILPILKAILGPNCDWFQLNLSQATRIHPGGEAQPAHRDEDMWPGPKSFEYLINVIWALDDFTLDNGATLIWPRSQFMAREKRPDRKFAEAAEMARGSAVIFLGSTLHCGGANISALPRTGINFSYCLGWLKQYENQFLAYPPKVARNLPRTIQDLIGYRIHRPNLGGYENQCPSVLFNEDCPDALPAIDALTPEIEERLKALREKAAAA